AGPGLRRLGNLGNPHRAGDSPLQLSDLNEEFLVIASHQLAMITSLPFVHTARRYYRLNGLVSPLDLRWHALTGCLGAEKSGKLGHLEE
ncbi:hypothetical protein GGH13_009250, partial [Coemansia sp. S155-1]